MRIAVAVALAGLQEVVEVDLPEGATLAHALEAARVAQRFPSLDIASLEAGIWGRARERSAVLREGDRVELYRPLEADPKDARRTRAQLKPSTRARNAP